MTVLVGVTASIKNAPPTVDAGVAESRFVKIAGIEGARSIVRHYTVELVTARINFGVITPFLNERIEPRVFALTPKKEALVRVAVSN